MRNITPPFIGEGIDQPYILPDSRFEMPELFIPGKQPLGKVKLTNRIDMPTLAFMFQQSMNRPIPGSRDTRPWTIDGDPKITVLGGKKCFNPVETQGTIVNSISTDHFLDSVGIVDNGEFTVAMGFYILDYSLNDEMGLFSQGSTGGSGGGYLYIHNGSLNNNLSWAINSYNIRATYTGYVDKYKWHNVVATTRHPAGDYEAELWLNGVNVASQVRTSITTSNQFGEIGLVYDGNYGDSFAGGIDHFYAWPREITDREIANYFANPYQYVEPK